MTSGTAPHVPYVTARRELLARPGVPGPGQRAALTALTDRWLADLLGPVEGVALVAVGGYGRGELVPGSDLYVLLLHDGRSAAQVGPVADRVWYPVWDAGVRLDHAVRGVAEARRLAASDLAVAVGLLDARHVAGAPELTAGLRSSVLADWRALARRRLPQLIGEARERARRHGELAFLLEPDLKDARGGLRDVVALRAVSATWLADRRHGPVERAHATLLDVRAALHMVTGRAADRLLLQEQDAVAALLGLPDADDLLRRLAEAGRAVAFAVDLAFRRVEQAVGSRPPGRLGLVRRRTGPGARSPLAHGVVEQDGEAVLARDTRPEQDATLLLRAASAAAQAGLPLAVHTVDRLAAGTPPLPVPWPPSARDALVRLLGAGPAAVPVLEALDQAGLLERLLPEWGRVRNLPQRNPVHRFTVDRHLVEAAAHAAGLARRVARPDLLLVGALLHDIGKGWPGDHSVTGAAVVARLARRLGFPPADVAVLRSLAAHHLLLPDTATRRDLDDPATVATVAAAVRTPDVLDLLHALAEADGLATGPAAWNAWKAALVADLVARVHRALPGTVRHGSGGAAGDAAEPSLVGLVGSVAAPYDGTARVEVGPPGPGGQVAVTVAAADRPGLLATVAGVLALHRLSVHAATVQTGPPASTPDGADGGAAGPGVAVQVWTVLPHFGSGPDPAALREDVHRALAGRLDVAGRLARREAAYRPRPGAPAAPPRVEVVPGASASATVLEVRAHDRPGLLHQVAAALHAAGADIRAARVSTLGAEVVDVFYLVDPAGQPFDPAAAQRLAGRVASALLDARGGVGPAPG